MLAVSYLPVALIHYYQNAIVATTLRYKDEVTDPSRFAEIRNLPEAGDEELALMTKIVDKLMTDLNLSIFHDGHKERIEAMIKSKMKGELAQVEAKRPKKRPWMIEPQKLPAFLAWLYNIFLTLLLSYHVFNMLDAKYCDRQLVITLHTFPYHLDFHGGLHTLHGTYP